MATTTTKQTDLTKALIAGLAKDGVKAKAVVGPAGNFYRVVVDGTTTIAYVDYRRNGGLRIEPKLTGSKPPRGFEINSAAKVQKGLGYVGLFAEGDSIAPAVAALKRAAEKASA